MKETRVDKRSILDEEPFSYKITKDKKVMLYWCGKQVSILRGKESERFMAKINDADIKEAQSLILINQGAAIFCCLKNHRSIYIKWFDKLFQNVFDLSD